MTFTQSFGFVVVNPNLVSVETETEILLLLVALLISFLKLIAFPAAEEVEQLH